MRAPPGRPRSRRPRVPLPIATGRSRIPVQSEDEHTTERRPIRSFVMRTGRLTAGQSRALTELWPRYGVDYSPAPLALDALFGRSAPRTLEIGFGNGEHL